MTWVIGIDTLLGPGLLVSDVCVSWQKPDGSYITKDCLQKIYRVSPSIMAGFAGSVEIGFALINSLTTFLKLPETEKGQVDWIPDRVARSWQVKARTLFSGSPSKERECKAEIIMVGAHPFEDAGIPRVPRMNIIKMAGPDFEPEIKFGLGQSISIGSGSNAEEYKRILKEIAEEQPLIELAEGDSLGWGKGLGILISQAISKSPSAGISDHLHFGFVTRRTCKLGANDRIEFDGDKRIDFKMPKVATSYAEFQKMAKAAGFGAVGAVA